MPSLTEVVNNYLIANPGQTAEQILTALMTVGSSQPDHTLYTVREIEIVLGGDLTKLGLVLGTMQAAAASNPVLAAFSQTLNTTGLDFSIATVQTMITQLATAGSWSSDITSAIQSIGTIPGVPMWQQSGLPSAPTLAQIQAILDYATWCDLANTIGQQVQAGTLTLAQAKSQMGAS